MLKYVTRSQLSPTSLRRALEGLLEKEFVIQDQDTGMYHVIDPVLKAYFRLYH